METELIKPVVKVGNSAGVLLPRKWLNSQARIVLEPLNIEKEILDILIEENLLKNILGIYLVGSYGRNEQSIESDVDVLVITDNVDKRIRKGKYEIILISEDKIKAQLENNALPILPMMIEAKSLLNNELIKEYKKTPLTKKNLNWHIKTTKEMMGKVLEDIKFSKKAGIGIGDASAYSLILRLRTLYIIDCFKKKRIWKKKEFLSLVKKISGSLDAYEQYVKVKNNKKRKIQFALKIKEAEKLMNYINKKTKELEKWLNEKAKRERGKRD